MALLGLPVGAAEGCEGGFRFAAFGSSYRELRTPLIPSHRRSSVSTNGNRSAIRPPRALIGFGRPVKPRWPEFDVEAWGKPAGTQMLWERQGWRSTLLAKAVFLPTEIYSDVPASSRASSHSDCTPAWELDLLGAEFARDKGDSVSGLNLQSRVITWTVLAR